MATPAAAAARAITVTETLTQPPLVLRLRGATTAKVESVVAKGALAPPKEKGVALVQGTPSAEELVLAIRMALAKSGIFEAAEKEAIERALAALEQANGPEEMAFCIAMILIEIVHPKVDLFDEEVDGLDRSLQQLLLPLLPPGVSPKAYVEDQIKELAYLKFLAKKMETGALLRHDAAAQAALQQTPSALEAKLQEVTEHLAERQLAVLDAGDALAARVRAVDEELEQLAVAVAAQATTFEEQREKINSIARGEDGR